LSLNEERYSPKDKRTTGDWLIRLLEKVKTGELSVAQAVKELSILPYEELHFAKIDHHRGLRTGFPEVIYGAGKTTEQIVTIAGQMAARSDRILITHTCEDVYTAVRATIEDARYNPVSNTIVVNRVKDVVLQSGITVVTAGTSDIPVAEEAVVTAELMGNRVEKIFDVGIAGIHRLLENLHLLRKSRVLVVVAGMEGALPGVIGGIVPVPIIAVPTSMGYGASFQGLAPLLTMLNSCAPGIAVVNIDNGFGAGYLAGLINMQKNGATDETDGD
jgi:NCAIR mutase (PurE)-related protein